MAIGIFIVLLRLALCNVPSSYNHNDITIELYNMIIIILSYV